MQSVFLFVPISVDVDFGEFSRHKGMALLLEFACNNKTMVTMS